MIETHVLKTIVGIYVGMDHWRELNASGGLAAGQMRFHGLIDYEVGFADQTRFRHCLSFRVLRFSCYLTD